jgi:hypothetical protein
MEDLYLQEIIVTIERAGYLANDLISNRKKTRKKANHTIETILKPKLIDISNKEEFEFEFLGYPEFHKFTFDYFDLIINREFEKAAKHAFSYIREFREGYIPMKKI